MAELSAHHDATLTLAVDVAMSYKYDNMVGDPQTVFGIAVEVCACQTRLAPTACFASFPFLGYMSLVL